MGIVIRSMTVRDLAKSNDNQPTHTPLAAGKFGIMQGVELRPYRPLGCPSVEQFEAQYSLVDDRDALPRSLS